MIIFKKVMVKTKDILAGSQETKGANYLSEQTAEPMAEPVPHAENAAADAGQFFAAEKIDRATQIAAINRRETVIIWVCLVSLVAMIAGAGWQVWRVLQQPRLDKLSIVAIQQSEGEPSTEEAVAVESPKKVEPAPTPVETKTVSKAELKVVVLNGGAPAGTAGKVKEMLMLKGYKKAEAKNAKGDYQAATVFFGAGFKEAAAGVIEDLKAKYPNAVVKEAVSAEEKISDVVVIMGK